MGTDASVWDYQVPVVPKPEIMTTRDRQTLELAVEKGYFKIPRETSLEELAEELGVRKHQTVSERLRRGINALATQMLEASSDVGADDRVFWATQNVGDNAKSYHSTPYCPELMASKRLPRAIETAKVEWHDLEKCSTCIPE